MSPAPLVTAIETTRFASGARCAKNTRTPDQADRLMDALLILVRANFAAAVGFTVLTSLALIWLGWPNRPVEGLWLGRTGHSSPVVLAICYLTGEIWLWVRRSRNDAGADAKLAAGLGLFILFAPLESWVNDLTHGVHRSSPVWLGALLYSGISHIAYALQTVRTPKDAP
jgi:hypothetical protein